MELGIDGENYLDGVKMTETLNEISNDLAIVDGQVNIQSIPPGGGSAGWSHLKTTYKDVQTHGISTVSVIAGLLALAAGIPKGLLTAIATWVAGRFVPNVWVKTVKYFRQNGLKTEGRTVAYYYKVSNYTGLIGSATHGPYRIR